MISEDQVGCNQWIVWIYPVGVLVLNEFCKVDKEFRQEMRELYDIVKKRNDPNSIMRRIRLENIGYNTQDW